MVIGNTNKQNKKMFTLLDMKDFEQEFGDTEKIIDDDFKRLENVSISFFFILGNTKRKINRKLFKRPFLVDRPVLNLLKWILERVQSHQCFFKSHTLQTYFTSF